MRIGMALGILSEVIFLNRRRLKAAGGDFVERNIRWSLYAGAVQEVFEYVARGTGC